MSGGQITFLAQGAPHAFKAKDRLRRWLHGVARHHGHRIDTVTYVLMSDEMLRGYNRRFLGRSYYTDVIAFDGQLGQGVSGDILLSFDRTKENARAYGASHQHELRRVMLHGLLHLLGHEDGTSEEKARMRKLEDELLARY